MHADQKKAGLAVLESDKTDFEAESHIKNKGQYFPRREAIIPLHLGAPSNVNSQTG